MTAVFSQLMKWPAALLLAAFFISGCQKQPEARLEVYNGFTMGTSFNVKWVAAEPDTTTRVGAAITAELTDVNASMSTYIADSELSRFNRSRSLEWQAISPGLAEVLSLAQRISQDSAGAFDVTVGPLVNLWGFGPDGRVVKAPRPEEIEALRQSVGYEKLELDPVRLKLRKAASQTYVDLSAIAKGYGVDRVARLLEAQGFDNYLVEIGGELRAKGVKPDGSSWLVAIESPVAGQRAIQHVIKVTDVAIATSGDYRNYFEEDGVRFSHTIDPQTGAPISHRLASVTVLAASCAQADATATALMVLGTDAGYAYAVSQGVEALFISKTASGFSERMTPGFKEYLVK